MIMEEGVEAGDGHNGHPAGAELLPLQHGNLLLLFCIQSLAPYVQFTDRLILQDFQVLKF